MEGPVCTLAPRTTVPAMHFPWVDVAPFLAIWGGVSGWEAHGLWFYNVTSVGWGEGGIPLYFSEIFNIFKYQ